MDLLTFGLTRGGAELPVVDFFGLAVQRIDVGELAVFGVEGRGRPAATDEALTKFDEIIRRTAELHPVVPHRFGLVTTKDAVEADLRHNAAAFGHALDLVEGRDEWLVRIRPRTDDVLKVADTDTVERIKAETTTIERGALVHGVVASSARRAAAVIEATLDGSDAASFTSAHDDALGADVVALMSRDVEVRQWTEKATVDVRRFADVELTGPGPAYRFAGRLTTDMVRREKENV
ncbi:MAG: hypothetical protein HKN41_12150 [Ilumatobacter sp.]|nr:hypothetical protein [Ilumatobacter sp.]